MAPQSRNLLNLLKHCGTEGRFQRLKMIKTAFKQGSGYANTEQVGPFRSIEKDGRKGLVATSIRSRLKLSGLGLNSEKGCCVFWALPLETLSTRAGRPKHDMHLPDPESYPLLSDAIERDRLSDGRFKFAWHAGWHPQMYLRLERGLSIEPVDESWTQAVASTNHITLKQNCWYCFAVVWNRATNRYAIYANGVKIAANNAFPDPSGVTPAPLFDIEALYSGHPCFAMGDFLFYNHDLHELELRALAENGGIADTDETRRLKTTYEGESLPPFLYSPGNDWDCRWNLSLDEPEHLTRFYIQGNQGAPSITDEGLLIETPHIDQPMRYYKHDDINQVYLWTQERFEGDLYLKFEFKPLLHGGLSLLCLQSSGMQREDFMEDYPLRTTGSMAMVHLEDVRNYHWEFFREMNDTRNDRASHALLKNPWLHGLAFACQPNLIELDQWHTLEFLQEGERLRGAIDNLQIFDVRDSPNTNNGPILNCGRIALRCMIRSKILYRNLEVWNRSQFEEA